VRILTSYLEKLPRNWRSIFLTLIYGLFAGGAAVAFEVGINEF
jgi:hypothetical protein